MNRESKRIALMSLMWAFTSSCAQDPSSLVSIVQVPDESSITLETESLTNRQPVVVTEVELQEAVARRWKVSPPKGFTLAVDPPDPDLRPDGVALTVVRWSGNLEIQPGAVGLLHLPLGAAFDEETTIQISYMTADEVVRRKGAYRMSVQNVTVL